MFGIPSNVPAFKRSSQNGFRCVIYPDPEKIAESAFQRIEFGEWFYVTKEKPIPDSIFEVYKEQFSYDKTDLNARVESRDESADYWMKERMTFDGGYGGERIIGILYLLKNVKPPYQTIIYGPGEQAIFRASSEKIENDMEFQVFLSFIIKNGRAAFYPVLKGIMERGDPSLTPIAMGYNNNSYQFTEYLLCQPRRNISTTQRRGRNIQLFLRQKKTINILLEFMNQYSFLYRKLRECKC